MLLTESQFVKKYNTPLHHGSSFAVIFENDPFLVVRKHLFFERQPCRHKYIDLYLAFDAHAKGQERVTSKSNRSKIIMT